MKNLKAVALILVLIGGLNWGLIGFFSIDLVAKLLGNWPSLVTVVYDLVGLSALWLVFSRPRV